MKLIYTKSLFIILPESKLTYQETNVSSVKGRGCREQDNNNGEWEKNNNKQIEGKNSQPLNTYMRRAQPETSNIKTAKCGFFSF